MKTHKLELDESMNFLSDSDAHDAVIGVLPPRCCGELGRIAAPEPEVELVCGAEGEEGGVGADLGVCGEVGRGRCEAHVREYGVAALGTHYPQPGFRSNGGSEDP